MKLILLLLSVLMLIFLGGDILTTPTTTVEGIFSIDKACYGSVGDVLLHDFVNDCESAERFEGLEVSVTGTLFELRCARDEQCPAGRNMKDVSVTIIGPGRCCEECVRNYQNSPEAVGPAGMKCSSLVGTPSCEDYFENNNMEVLNCLSETIRLE